MSTTLLVSGLSVLSVSGLLWSWRILEYFKAYRKGYSAGYEAALSLEQQRWVSDVSDMRQRLLKLREELQECHRNGQCSWGGH